MTSSPTPLERLLRLEQDLDKLRTRLDLPVHPTLEEASSPPRALWPGDELLLTRLLRRSHIALAAYQATAEITTTDRQGLLLQASTTPSDFLFCELIDGDAVVWIQPNPPDWLLRSPTFAQLFHLPSDIDAGERLLIQTLPHFKPVVRRELWTLVRQGELVSPSRFSAERSERDNPLRRLEALERKVQTLISTQAAEIGQLRHELAATRDLFQQLSRLYDHHH
jgi:hypothetical protein